MATTWKCNLWSLYKLSSVYSGENESFNRAGQRQLMLHTQISALPHKNLLLFHFYHHHVFTPEMLWWEIKDRDSAIGMGSKTLRFHRSLLWMSHLSAFVSSPCTAWRGKVIENSREEERVVLALPFPQAAVPMHPCLVQFSADRDLQQTNLLKSGTSLAAPAALTAQRLEQTIPIKPLERFLSLKGENSKAAIFATNKPPAFPSAGASFAPAHSKFSFSSLLFCHHNSLPGALYLIPFYGSHVQHCLVQIMKARTPPATAWWVVNLPYLCSGNPCAIFWVPKFHYFDLVYPKLHILKSCGYESPGFDLN